MVETSHRIQSYLNFIMNATITFFEPFFLTNRLSHSNLYKFSEWYSSRGFIAVLTRSYYRHYLESDETNSHLYIPFP